MIKLIYCYGLQPGSALILLAIIETIFFFDNIWISYAENLHWPPEKAGFVMGMMVLYLIINGTCLCYGAVLRGNKKLLTHWMVIEIFFLVILGLTFSIYFLVSLVIAKEPEYRDYFYQINFHKTLYESFAAGLIISYDVNLVMRCLPLLSSETAEDELKPTGKGLTPILKYYRSNPSAAVSLGLMTDIVVMVRPILLGLWATGYIFNVEYEYYNEVFRLEDTIMIYIRLILGIFGFVIVKQKRTSWFFYWSILYGASILTSLGFFVYATVTWQEVHIGLKLAHLGADAIKILFRTGVLLMSVRYLRDSGEQDEIPDCDEIYEI